MRHVCRPIRLGAHEVDLEDLYLPCLATIRSFQGMHNIKGLCALIKETESSNAGEPLIVHTSKTRIDVNFHLTTPIYPVKGLADLDYSVY